MYLYLSADLRKRAVFRMLRLEHLESMFRESANTLVRPIAWRDPFENFVAHLRGRLPGGEEVEFAQRYDFYGQCWTLLGGSDAMWSIYSPDRRSVRIKVTLADLHDALAAQARGPAYAGAVRYVHADDMQAWTRRVVHSTRRPSLDLLARTFLVKRKAFEHEHELRLLYCGVGHESGPLYRHAFDAHRLVRQITLDPRLGADEAAELTALIRARTGFRGTVDQSDLYAPPAGFELALGPAHAALPRQRARVSYDGDRRIASHKADTIAQIVLPAGGAGTRRR